MGPVTMALARDRIQSWQATAALDHDAHIALVHSRTSRRAERAERKTRRIALAAQRLRARVADLEAGR